MHHHALLVRKSVTAEEALLLCPVDENTEVFVVPETEIGIGEVRSLTIEASRRPREATDRLLVVLVASLTFEAQQALLKLIEEPPVTTGFLFVIPPEISLLPTLASRFFVVTSPTVIEPLGSSLFTTFLESSIAERLEQIGTRTQKKDTAWLDGIKAGLMNYLATQAGDSASVQVLGFIVTHLNTRGASNKLLLEELALSLPSSRRV